MIAALARNGVIGRGGTLPWHLPADLKRFKTLTTGRPLVMGRKTWDSIGRPLPGRRTFVVSRSPAFRADGAEVAATLDDALSRAGAADEHGLVFVAGGAEIYAQALPRADRLHLTFVDADVEGDARFPYWDAGEFRLTFEEPHPADDLNALPYRFADYERSATPR